MPQVDDPGPYGHSREEGHPGDHGESVESPEALAREGLRLVGQADRLVRVLAARAGLDADAFRCLHVLLRQGELPPRRLAALAGLEPHAAFAVIDRLAEAGLVRRDQGETGRLVVRADQAACHARIGPVLRELREFWHACTARRCDDLALVAVVIADGRRLTELVRTLG